MDILDLVHENQDAISRPFLCSYDPVVCKKAFARRSDLIRHERIHKNERPFQCEICGKSFIQRSALTVHFRVHTGERPHVCLFDGCERAFSDSSSLARHRRVHTGKRPYKCAVKGCWKTFCRKTTLTKHIKRNHTLQIHSELNQFTLVAGDNLMMEEWDGAVELEQPFSLHWKNMRSILNARESPSSDGLKSPAVQMPVSVNSQRQHSATNSHLGVHISPSPGHNSLSQLEMNLPTTVCSYEKRIVKGESPTIGSSPYPLLASLNEWYPASTPAYMSSNASAPSSRFTSPHASMLQSQLIGSNIDLSAEYLSDVSQLHKDVWGFAELQPPIPPVDCCSLRAQKYPSFNGEEKLEKNYTGISNPGADSASPNFVKLEISERKPHSYQHVVSNTGITDLQIPQMSTHSSSDFLCSSPLLSSSQGSDFSSFLCEKIDSIHSSSFVSSQVISPLPNLYNPTLPLTSPNIPSTLSYPNLFTHKEIN